LLHHMGPVDSTGNVEADGVTQGVAQGDMFRTSPLWGLGKRVFFMHDGRITDLEQAIQAHLDTYYSVAAFNYIQANPSVLVAPPSVLPPIPGSVYGYSEADVSVSLYNNLSVNDQDNILEFLRSL
ncbi:MAG TPA: di-heme oxidoredictase family protein, partial [Opitutaceae bacterium]|nr:di-heme oxidoredictase family protein [Opitutaceae bacterium]